MNVIILHADWQDILTPRQPELALCFIVSCAERWVVRPRTYRFYSLMLLMMHERYRYVIGAYVLRPESSVSSDGVMGIWPKAVVQALALNSTALANGAKWWIPLFAGDLNKNLVIHLDRLQVTQSMQRIVAAIAHPHTVYVAATMPSSMHNCITWSFSCCCVIFAASAACSHTVPAGRVGGGTALHAAAP